MLRILKKAAAIVAAGMIMMFSLAGCGDDKIEGNLSEVKYNPDEEGVYAVINVKDFGEITCKLFPKAAPKSVERFIEFAERGYYDNRTIHRVIKNYLIQGGSLNGDGSDGNIPESQYVPVETSDQTYNFYGALCFASSKNGSYAQFYIVNNNKPPHIDTIVETISGQLADEAFSARLTPEDKEKYENYIKSLKEIKPEVKEKYEKVGGNFELDGTSTVFGQVIKGFDVLQAISSVEVVSGNKIDDKKETPSKPIDSITIETIEIIRIEPANAEETTTTKKAGAKTVKTTTADEIINAETLPTISSSEDTTAPADGGEGSDSAEDGDSTPAAGASQETSQDNSQDAGNADQTAVVTEISAESSSSEEDIVVVDGQ